MSIPRPFWENILQNSWKKRSILWLAGVRRSGKTTLSKSLSDFNYFNCDDSDIQSQLKNPKYFLNSIKTKGIVFDEIHQLGNATQVLKIV
jgi:predicted AAA+ superfamily ATPase